MHSEDTSQEEIPQDRRVVLPTKYEILTYS